jgi:outer membrane lipoprotein-sorting protein
MADHMKKGILALTAAAVIGITAGTSPAAPTQMMSPVLTKMEQAGKNLKTLQAGISQQKIDRTLGVPENSAGTLFYKAAAAGNERVLLQYTSPIPETVSVVGDKVTIFQPKINQVFVTTRKASANKNRSLGFLGLGYSEAAVQLRDKYAITILGEDTINGVKTTQIQLDPKDKSEGVLGIQLWVAHDTWLPVKYFVVEKSAKTTITLSAMKTNQDLPDSKFEIDGAEGATVVQG